MNTRQFPQPIRRVTISIDNACYAFIRQSGFKPSRVYRRAVLQMMRQKDGCIDDQHRLRKALELIYDYATFQAENGHTDQFFAWKTAKTGRKSLKTAPKLPGKNP